MKKSLFILLISLIACWSVSAQTSEEIIFGTGENFVIGTTGDDYLPVLGIHRDGEVFAMKYSNVNGLPERFVFRKNEKSPLFYLNFDENGLPMRGSHAGIHFTCMNYSDSTFDIGILTPEGKTEIRKGVKAVFPVTLMGALKIRTTGSGPGIKTENITVSYYASDILGWAGTAASVAGCGLAFFSGAGILAAGLPCVSALTDVLSKTLPEKYSEQKQQLSDFNKLLGVLSFASPMNNLDKWQHVLNGLSEASRAIEDNFKKPEFMQAMTVLEDQMAELTPPAGFTPVNATTMPEATGDLITVAKEGHARVVAVQAKIDSLGKTATMENYVQQQKLIDKENANIEELKATYQKKLQDIIDGGTYVIPFVKTSGDRYFAVYGITLTGARWQKLERQPSFNLDIHFSSKPKKVKWVVFGTTYTDTHYLKYMGVSFFSNKGEKITDYGLTIGKSIRSAGMLTTNIRLDILEKLGNVVVTKAEFGHEY